MPYNFDTPIDRFNSNAAKFKREYLLEIFKTEDLYPFWIADQDLQTSPEIIESLIARAQNGVFGYECKSAAFMQSIVNWYQRRFNCEIQSAWIQFSPTIISSVAMVLDLFTEDQDGVIIQPPVYQEFENVIQKTNRTVYANNLILHDHRYEMDYDHLNSLCQNPKTKALLISNPHNPGGRVWSKEGLQKIVNICIQNKILLISDEIHADVIFKPYKFTSLLSFKEIHDQLIVCYSPSKIFNLAGISDAMAIIPNLELRTEFERLKLRYNLGRTNAFASTAMETGFNTADQWIDQLNTYIKSNVDYISDFIQNHIPNIRLIQQEGTYLVWLDVSQLPIQGIELIQYLAKHAKIGVNNGDRFGKPGEGFIRMNISCPKSIIVDAMHNLKSAVDLLFVQNSEQNC